LEIGVALAAPFDNQAGSSGPEIPLQTIAHKIEDRFLTREPGVEVWGVVLLPVVPVHVDHDTKEF
jgi:hypothetical protein